MKVLVTGSLGMLGRARAGLLVPDHRTIAADIDDFDITDRRETLRFVLETRPQVIVHTAAYTDVDGAERNPKAAMLVNAAGSANVAVAAREVEARLVLVSTDFVFDGEKNGPYTESDWPNPLNQYGRSKLAGEELAAAALISLTVVRTAWLYGTGGQSFLSRILKAAGKKKKLRVVTDVLGSPTWTSDLADGIVRLIESGPGDGVYHLAGGGSCSRYELAVEWFRLLGLEDVTVEKATSGEFPAAARRPANSALTSERLEAEGIPPLRTWPEALREFASAEGESMLEKWWKGNG